jgi:TPR repeat protein
VKEQALHKERTEPKRRYWVVLLLSAMLACSLACRSAASSEAADGQWRTEQERIESVVADEPHACDEAAADPQDPSRYAEGVDRESIIPVVAMRRCYEAIEQFPSEARFRYQYARGLDAGGYADEAIDAYYQAAEMEYCPAYASIADAYLYGWISDGSGTERETALALYQESADCGYEPAAVALNMLTFRPDGFRRPDIVTALYEGRIEDLNMWRPLVASYVRGIHDFISMDFNAVGNECPSQVSQPVIERALDSAEIGDPGHALARFGYDLFLKLAAKVGPFFDVVWQGDIQKYRDQIKGIGMKDGQYLANEFGCDGPVTKQVYDGIVAFSGARKSLVDVYKDLKQRYDAGLSLEIPMSPDYPLAVQGETGEE